MFLPHAAIVMNITVVKLSATSLRVSWDRLDIPEITGYLIYYTQTEMLASEKSLMVPSSEHFANIEDLMTGVEFQFQVVAVAEFDGDIIMGERSNVSVSRLSPTNNG